MSTGTNPTTQSFPAYEPPHSGVTRSWQLVIAGLLLTGLVSLALRPVCGPEQPGANELGFGVRHEQRGKAWDHCEPWIRRVVRG